MVFSVLENVNMQFMIKYIFSIFLFSVVGASAQTVPTTPEEYEKQYNQNIRKAKIDGIYIPKNMDEAIQEIIRLSPAESLAKFKGADEDMVVKKLHFGLGKWLSFNWNFDGGSRYSHYLRMMGVTYPDDMINFTLRSLHKYLNDVPLDLEKRAKAIKDKRKKEFDDKYLISETIDTIPK